METSGATTPGAVRDQDLAELVARPGRTLTVYLTTEQAIENAAQKSEARWRALVDEIRALDADPDAVTGAIDAITPLVEDAHLEGECLVAVADDGGVRFVEHLEDPPARDA